MCIAAPIEWPVAVASSDVEELAARLARTRWPTAPQYNGRSGNGDWSYGTNLDALMKLCARWQESFDWWHWEAALNRLPGYRVDIDGVPLHFLHIRTAADEAFPLLIVHGWPSSVFEYLELAPLLVEPTPNPVSGRTRGFHLVIPSLPGHGLSGVSPSQPLSIFRAADLFHRLMTDALGYRRYGAHGGDWGAYAASRLGRLYPEAVAGIHLSYLVGGLTPYLGPGAAPLSPTEEEMRRRRILWNDEEGGYEHLQRTRPQTLAYALTDSPAGLAGYILEKWRAWTDCDGDPVRRFGADRLLANISWYWFTRSGGTALRLYRDTALDPWQFGPGERIEIPTAVASFPRELVVSPREWGERLYDIRQWTAMPRGGHFAAIEEPELLSADVRKFFLDTLGGL
jgi:pimeloyl-ACP methyl ester carboxylesterase